MNKKLQSIKMILVAVGLLMGASAWADNVYTILYGTPVYDTDGVTITGVTAQTDFTSDDGSTASDVTSSDANGDNCTNAMPIGGSVLYSNSSFSKSFETAATKGTVHFEANYTATTNGSQTWKIVDSNGIVIFGSTNAGESNGNATKDWGFCNGESLGTGYFRQARKGHNRIVLDIKLASKVVSYTVLVSSGNNSYTTLTGTYNLPASVTDVKGLTATKQTYYSYMDNVSFYNVYDDAVTEAAYTINYQLSGTTVASETGAGAVGSTVNAQTSIWNKGNTQKYFATSDATTSFTIAEGTNEFNVAVREAETWTYYVKAYKGSDELMTISTNTVVEGETASYGYPQYISVGGVLYKSTAKSNSPWWGESYTITENNAVRGFQYAKEGNEGIIFCSEAEDIDGLTVVSGGNTDIRASNRKGAYATAETTITTLEPGIYRVFGATYGNSGTTFTLKAGDATVFSVATNGNPSHTTGDYFLITETTDLVMPAAGNGGNSPKVMDYIIVQKAGEYYETMSIVGDFSANGWDATQGIAMTRNADNPFEWTTVVSDYTVYSSDMWFEYKAVANGNWDDYVLGNPNATNTDKNQEFNFDYDGAREGIYTLTFTVNTQAHSVELSVAKQATAQVYFVNTKDWEAPYIWVWDANNSNYNYTGGNWAGVAMTKTEEQQDGNDVYTWSTYDITGTPTNIIFSNNGADQTGDLVFVDGATYKADGTSTVSKTISAAGYATYCSTSALDFSNTGLTAYIAKKGDDNKVTFTAVEKVPANTGVLLKGDAGDYTINTSTEATDNVTDNVLVGVTKDTKKDAGIFVLMNGTQGVGFYKTTKEFTVGANTAYIEALTDGEARTFIGFDFEDNTTTGISSMHNAQCIMHNEVYNLNGQRVMNAKKGLYIVNGKKVIK